MTPQEFADDIMRRCWWDEKRAGSQRPRFEGLDVEIMRAIIKAVAVEREECAKIVENFKTAGPSDEDGIPTHVTYWGEGIAAIIRGRLTEIPESFPK